MSNNLSMASFSSYQRCVNDENLYVKLCSILEQTDKTTIRSYKNIFLQRLQTVDHLKEFLISSHLGRLAYTINDVKLHQTYFTKLIRLRRKTIVSVDNSATLFTNV